jgi:hypothetical protein
MTSRWTQSMTPLPDLPPAQWFPGDLVVPLQHLHDSEVQSLRFLMGAHLTTIPTRWDPALFRRNRLIDGIRWKRLVADLWHRRWFVVVDQPRTSLGGSDAAMHFLCLLTKAGSLPQESASACLRWLQCELNAGVRGSSFFISDCVRALTTTASLETVVTLLGPIGIWSVRSQAIADDQCDVIPGLVTDILERFSGARDRTRLLHLVTTASDLTWSPTGRHVAAGALLFHLGSDAPLALHHVRRMITGRLHLGDVTLDLEPTWTHGAMQVLDWADGLVGAGRWTAFQDETILGGLMALAMKAGFPSYVVTPLDDFDEREQMIRDQAAALIGIISQELAACAP